MVTHFDRHWDEISETSYSLKMLKGKMSINELQKHIKLEIPTIFIKLRKSATILKCGQLKLLAF